MSTVSVPNTLEEIRLTLQSVKGLTILRGVLTDSPAQNLLHLLAALSATEPVAEQIAQLYAQTFLALAETANQADAPALTDAWQGYLVSRLVDTQSLWTALIERSGPSQFSPALRSQAQRDLRVIQRLFQLSAEVLLQLTLDLLPALLTGRQVLIVTSSADVADWGRLESHADRAGEIRARIIEARAEREGGGRGQRRPAEDHAGGQMALIGVKPLSGGGRGGREQGRNQGWCATQHDMPPVTFIVLTLAMMLVKPA